MVEGESKDKRPLNKVPVASAYLLLLVKENDPEEASSSLAKIPLLDGGW